MNIEELEKALKSHEKKQEYLILAIKNRLARLDAKVATLLGEETVVPTEETPDETPAEEQDVKSTNSDTDDF